MGFAERFEDLKIWQESRILANLICDLAAKNRDFELLSQIQSAALSGMNNIAEGFERRTKRDFAHFLDQAKGSSGEVRSMLYLAEDRKYAAIHVTTELRARYAQRTTPIGALASRQRNP